MQVYYVSFVICNMFFVIYNIKKLIKKKIQHFMASFRDKVVGEGSCVVPAAFLLLNRSVYLPQFTLHLILLSRVTLRVCRREKIRRKEECIV